MFHDTNNILFYLSVVWKFDKLHSLKLSTLNNSEKFLYTLFKRVPMQKFYFIFSASPYKIYLFDISEEYIVITKFISLHYTNKILK